MVRIPFFYDVAAKSQAANTWVYSGLSAIFPARTIFTITGFVEYSQSLPTGVLLSNSNVSNESWRRYACLENNEGARHVSYSGVVFSQITIYFWTRCNGTGANRKSIQGYYMSID